MEKPDPPSIFICHSSEDSQRVTEIVERLEAAGLRCWVAPRNIAPGETYPEAILRGIENCDALVVVLSRHSNESQHVHREIERAVDLKKRVVPVRIEDVRPSGTTSYLLATLQMIDAFQDDLQLDALVEHFNGGDPGTPAMPMPATQKPSGPAKQGNPKLLAGVAIAIAAAVAVWLITKNPPTEDPTPPPPAATAGWKERLDAATQGQLQRIPQQFGLSLKVPGSGSDQPAFKIGEPIRFVLRSEKEAHVIVIAQSSDGSEVVVFPNTEHRDTRVAAGENIELPGDGMRLTAAEPAGTDVVFAVASTDPEEIAAFVARLEAAGGKDFPFAAYQSPETRGVILSQDGSGSATGEVTRKDLDGSPAAERSFAGLAFAIEE